MSVYPTACMTKWMSAWLNVCLAECLQVCRCVYLYVLLKPCLPEYMSAPLFVCSFVHLSVYLYAWLVFFTFFVYLSVYLFAYLSEYLSVCLSVCTPVSLLVCPYISARIYWRKIKPVIAKWQSLKKTSTHDGYTELINGRKEEGKKLEQKGGVIKIGQGERGMKGAFNELKENWTNEWNDRQTVKNNGGIPGEWYRWMNNWNNEWRLGGLNGMRWKRNGMACKRRLNAVKTYRRT